MSIRRGMTAVLSAAVVAGVLVGATPASAATASPATISMDYSGGSYGLSASTLTGNPGDTFTFTSNIIGQTLYLQGATGSISVGAVACVPTACPVTPGSSEVVTIDSVGTIDVVGSSTWTFTISEGSSATSSGPTDPALVYPTATFDPNGGSCPDNQQTQFIKGEDVDPQAVTPMGCSRDGYRLAGWAYSSTATDRDFPDATMIPIGDESFTLYAVWVPVGVQVTYDANVGAGADCMVGGESTNTRASTSVVAAGSKTETTAPCTPPNMVLAGWALTGDGDVAVQPGGALPSDWANGSSHRLYAKWQVTYGLSLSQVSQEVAPASTPSVTLTATRNGQPAVGATISYQWTGEDEFGSFALDPQTVTLNDLGAATVRMGAKVGSEGFATVTAAYGDTTASATFTVVQPVVPSITITGERGFVKGKPGVMVDGLTTGFAEGEKFVPYIKFPGQTSYVAGTARPTVDADGELFWQRKTGKKIYIYFTSEDGTLRSNRIIIQAK